MAVRSRGQKKEFVDEVKAGGVATQVELEEAIAQHLAEYSHGTTTDDGIPVEPYYYDAARDRYLAFDTVTVSYYLDGTNRKNMYMYNVPGVSSNSVPHKVTGEYCIVGWDYFSTSTESGNVMEVRNAAGASVLDIVLTTTTNSESNTTTDTLVTDELLSGYVLNNGIDTPVLKVYLKKTYYPDV
jgi:hypothetical protein